MTTNEILKLIEKNGFADSRETISQHLNRIREEWDASTSAQTRKRLIPLFVPFLNKAIENNSRYQFRMILEFFTTSEIATLFSSKNEEGLTPLMKVVRCENPEILSDFIGCSTPQDRFAAFKEQDPEGNNALMTALKEGHLDYVNAILRDRSSTENMELISQTNNNGDTALLMATRLGDPDAVRTIFSYFDKPDKQNLLQQTNKRSDKNALLIAIESEKVEIVDALLRIAGEVNELPSLLLRKNRYGKCPLKTAFKMKNVEIQKMILSTIGTFLINESERSPSDSSKGKELFEKLVSELQKSPIERGSQGEILPDYWNASRKKGKRLRQTAFALAAAVAAPATRIALPSEKNKEKTGYTHKNRLAAAKLATPFMHAH